MACDNPKKYILVAGIRNKTGEIAYTNWVNKSTKAIEVNPITVTELEANMVTAFGNEVEYIFVELDGDSVNTTAVGFESASGGTVGQQFVIDFPFRSLTIAWKRGTAQASSVQVNDLVYVAGEDGTASYDDPFFALNPDESCELITDSYNFTANSGAKVQLVIAVDKVA